MGRPRAGWACSARKAARWRQGAGGTATDRGGDDGGRRTGCWQSPLWGAREALVAVGLVALAALMLTFALPRHTRLPVRLAAVLVALAALGAHLGGQAYARLHPGPPPGALCYVLIVVPQKTPSPQQRLETLARLVARGAISKVVAERAGRVK